MGDQQWLPLKPVSVCLPPPPPLSSLPPPTLSVGLQQTLSGPLMAVGYWKIAPSLWMGPLTVLWGHSVQVPSLA